MTGGSTFNFTTTMPDSTDGGTDIIAAPIGPSGIVLLGGTHKCVTRGIERTSSFSDTGLLPATIAFAAGESSVTLCGHAPWSPYAFALEGSTNSRTYASTTHSIAWQASPGNSGTATVAFSLAALPSWRIASSNSGPLRISWPCAAAGYVLEMRTGLASPVVCSPGSDSLTATSSQNFGIITNIRPARFDWWRQSFR